MTETRADEYISKGMLYHNSQKIYISFLSISELILYIQL